jgi:asparaginyl-tRNA synthetase
VEKHFKCPVILFDYPANIKAFYMRLNEWKNSSRHGYPFPGGEIVGGLKEKNVLMF